MLNNQKPYMVGYVTAGGVAGAVGYHHHDTADNAARRFAAQGAAVRVIHHVGDKAEVIKEVCNG